MQPDGLTTVGSAQISTLRNGLRIMALRALGDDHAAEDAVQEALLRALSAVTPEIASDAGRLGAFVGGIARHVIADAQRAARRSLTHSSDLYAIAADLDALRSLLREEEQAQVRAAIERLPNSDQIVIRASFYEGLTPTEIAERLYEPVARVRKRKSRALARLRAALLPVVSHESAAAASNKADSNAPVVAQGGG
ncbi:MAG: sigma-70 family RNA polymerase sigma factor [Gemmatimonadota bacterium]